jgi:hypothetical protein
MKIAITIKLRTKLIKPDSETDNKITYFGKLIFLNRSPLPTIELTPPAVTSAK